MKNLLFILFFLSLKAGADGYIRQPYESTRPTGMGNAFLALVDDANALWYNPAGLARIKGVHFHLIDTQIGVDNSDTLGRMNGAFFKGEYNNLIRQDSQFIGVNFRPTFIMPYFGFAVYEHGHGMFDLQNLTSTGVDVYAYNDLGAIVGLGIPMGEFFSIGASVKAVQRTGVDIRMTPMELIQSVGVTQSDFQANVFDYLKNRSGVGYAFPLTVGVLGTIPQFSKGGPVIRFAATAEDVGNTSFTKLTDAEAPQRIKMSYNFGLLLQYPTGKGSVFNLTSDVRHALEDYPLSKVLHLGAEYRHKYFGVRAGMYQGYASFGASIEFPPHTRLHFSSYSQELGASYWEREQRWYLMQLVIGFNPL